MNQIQVFRSMLSAVTYVLGTHGDHAFEVEAVAASSRLMADLSAAVAEMEFSGTRCEVLDTLDTLYTHTGEAGLYSVASDLLYGYVLVHYTQESQIVRFVAIPAQAL